MLHTGPDRRKEVAIFTSFALFVKGYLSQSFKEVYSLAKRKKNQQSKVEHIFNFVSFFLSKKEERCNCPNVDLFSLPECQGQMEGKQTQAASSRQLGTQCRACCHMMAEVCLCHTETLNRKIGGQLHQVRNPHSRICCIRNRDSE